jgi:hypothetical protein
VSQHLHYEQTDLVIVHRDDEVEHRRVARQSFVLMNCETEMYVGAS